MAAAAYAESVERELPDDPVDAGEEITVWLTQEGFLFDASNVAETLPDGFVYVGGSYTGNKIPVYDTNTNTLTVEFAGSNEITESYNVTAGTLGQIMNAKFNGTYHGFVGGLSPEYEREGPVTGDDTLTAGQTPSYDLNGDGTITPVDALIALEMASGNCVPDGDADVSGDGKVTSLDALMLMQVAADNINI